MIVVHVQFDRRHCWRYSKRTSLIFYMDLISGCVVLNRCSSIKIQQNKITNNMDKIIQN